jgi:hypothetical protein
LQNLNKGQKPIEEVKNELSPYQAKDDDSSSDLSGGGENDSPAANTRAKRGRPKGSTSQARDMLGNLYLNDGETPKAFTINQGGSPIKYAQPASRRAKLNAKQQLLNKKLF